MSNDNTAVPNILVEFVEAAIHNILRVRKIYPDVIFCKMQKYGCILFKSMHHQLNEYIENCISAAYYFAKNGQLSKILICFTSRNEVLEKVVFDVLSMKETIVNDHYLIETESLFRQFFVKLNYRNVFLNTLPEDTSFTIQIYTTQSEAINYMNNPAFQNFPWIHTDANHNDIKKSNIVPLLTIEKNTLNVQVYVVSKDNRVEDD